jgi:Flp pilus assembly protein TadD
MKKRSILFFGALLVLLFCVPAWSADETGDLDMKDAEAYHAKGYEAQMQGNLRQAQFLYERARAFNPNDPGILNDLGLVYEALGETTAAEAQYLKAIEIDFKCLPAYSNLGYFYKAKGDYQKAMYYFDSRVKYGDPKDKWTLEAQSMIGEIERLSPEMRRKKMKADKQVLENAMVLRARERVRVSTRDKSVNAEIEYQRGLMFFGSQQYDAAAKSFEACLKDNPGHKMARHMLARAISMPSLRVAMKQTQVDPDKVSVGKSQHFKNDPVNGLAMKELEASAQQEVGRKAVRRVLERMNGTGSSRTISKQVAVKSNDPVDVAVIEYTKGMRLMKDGYPEEAVKAFDRALIFSPDDADIQAARMKALGK